MIAFLHYLDVQRQISPWFRKLDLMSVGTTLLMLASGKTMAAFFPPNSKLHFFIIGAAIEAILLPTAVLPVNEMIRTSGCWTRNSPALGPRPKTTLKTPLGNPISCKELIESH